MKPDAFLSLIVYLKMVLDATLGNSLKASAEENILIVPTWRNGGDVSCSMYTWDGMVDAEI